MKLEQLQYLLSIYETGTIAQTAELHNISRQAVSKAIKALEDELRVSLLARSAKRVTLTPVGLLVCQFAQKVDNDFSALLENIAPYQTKSSSLSTNNSLQIYAVARYLTPKFFSLINTFKRQLPHLNAVICNETAEFIVNRVCFTSSSLGLLTVYDSIPTAFLQRLQDKNLSYQILKLTKFMVCVHKNSPLASHKVLFQDNLDSYQSVTFNYSFGFNTPDWNQQSPHFKIDTFEQQKRLMSQENCYCFCTPNEYQAFFQKNHVLLPQEDASFIHFIAVMSPEHEPIIDAFCQKLSLLL